MINIQQLQLGNIVSPNAIIDESDLIVLDRHKFISMLEFEAWRGYYPIPLTAERIASLGLKGTHWEKTKLKYVHSLQNVYFWNTGNLITLEQFRYSFRP